MKGLIYKDLFLLKQVIVSMAFISVFYLMLGYVGGGEVNYFPMMAMIINMMASYACSGYDERCDWDSFGCSLPVSRIQIVISRYITNILLIIATSVLVVASEIFYMAVYGWDINLYEMFSSIVGSMLMISIINPITYKFNVNKSRIIAASMFFVVGVLCSICAIYFMIGRDASEVSLNMGLIAAAALVACVGIYVMSMLLSISIYKKKEF